MNSPVAPVSVAQSERRLARWIILALLIMVTPVLVVALGVASMFRLSSEAAMLRKEVMAASGSEWSTKVQVSAGWCALTTARTILRAVEHEHQAEARLALAAVRRASVGVYERVGRAGEMSAGRIVTELDRKMQKRGWSRLVGVMERHETVLVYASDEVGAGGKLEVCVAVLDGNEMVIVSTKLDADKLLELASKHLPAEGFRSKLRQETI